MNDNTNISNRMKPSEALARSGQKRLLRVPSISSGVKRGERQADALRGQETPIFPSVNAPDLSFIIELAS